MISYTYIRKSSSRILAAALGVLLGLPTASAKDIQTALGYWASQEIDSKKCIPKTHENSSHASQSTHQPQLASCAPNNQTLPINLDNISSDVGQVSLKQLEREEGDFFYDFSHDQIHQSQCEMKLLDALDQLPDVPDAPAKIYFGAQDTIARALTLATADHSSIKADELGRTNQKAVLDDIWNKLPQLDILDQAVKHARNALPGAALKALGEEVVNGMPSNGYSNFLTPEQMLQFGNKIEAYKNATAGYNLLLSQVMHDSGSENVIKKYTENLLREKRNGLTYDQFVSYALQPIDPSRPELSFQKQVVEPIRHTTIQRLCDYQTFTSDSKIPSMWNDSKTNHQGVCGDYHVANGWTSDPENQTNAERERKRFLMESDAPLDFMNRVPKYRQDYGEFSCMLMGKYREGPKIIYWTSQAAMLAFTFGAGTAIEMLQAGFTIEEIENMHIAKQFVMANYKQLLLAVGPVASIPTVLLNQCSHDGATNPGSTIDEPVCEKIKPKDPTNAKILTESLHETNCATAFVLTMLQLKLLTSAPATSIGDLVHPRPAPSQKPR